MKSHYLFEIKTAIIVSLESASWTKEAAASSVKKIADVYICWVIFKVYLVVFKVIYKRKNKSENSGTFAFLNYYFQDK